MPKKSEVVYCYIVNPLNKLDPPVALPKIEDESYLGAPNILADATSYGFGASLGGSYFGGAG
jgi:hypothetical protein